MRNPAATNNAKDEGCCTEQEEKPKGHFPFHVFYSIENSPSEENDGENPCRKRNLNVGLLQTSPPIPFISSHFHCFASAEQCLYSLYKTGNTGCVLLYKKFACLLAFSRDVINIVHLLVSSLSTARGLYRLYKPAYNPATGLRTPWPPLFKTCV